MLVARVLAVKVTFSHPWIKKEVKKGEGKAVNQAIHILLCFALPLRVRW